MILGGSYGAVPARFRSQADFTGPHEIYVGYYDGSTRAAIPRDPYSAEDSGPRYWIHDPIAKSSGAWWPATVVHAFGWTAGWSGSWATAAGKVDTSNYVTWAGLDKYADQPLTAADIDKITAWASSQGVAGILSGLGDPPGPRSPHRPRPEQSRGASRPRPGGGPAGPRPGRE